MSRTSLLEIPAVGEIPPLSPCRLPQTMNRFFASLESLGLRLPRSPGAVLLILVALGLGPITAAFQRLAPIGDPDTMVAELSTLLLATLATCWSLRQMQGLDPIRRIESGGQRALVDAGVTLIGSLVVVGLARASLAHSGLETPWGPQVWACTKLSVLAFGLRCATSCSPSMLLVVVWGAPQLGLSPVTAALGLQAAPQIHVEALYLAGLTLIALAAPRRCASS